MALEDYQVAKLPTKEEILLAQQFKEQNPNWEVNQPMATVMPEKGMQAAVATYHQLDKTFAHFDRTMRNPSYNQPIAFDSLEKPFNEIKPEVKPFNEIIKQQYILFNEIIKQKYILPDGNGEHDMDEFKKTEIN